MNGRVYDPNLGRFLSVDPVFEFPTNTQSLNPYSYVLNNPLSLTDPTGYTIDQCTVAGDTCGTSVTINNGWGGSLGHGTKWWNDSNGSESKQGSNTAQTKSTDTATIGDPSQTSKKDQVNPPPPPPKSGDAVNIKSSDKKDGTVILTVNILGKKVPVVFVKKYSSYETGVLKARINGLVSVLNEHANELSKSDIDTIHNIKSIRIDDTQRTGTVVKTGTFIMRSSYIESNSIFWLASAVAHDSIHVEQYERSGFNPSFYNQITAPSLEIEADKFQLRIGKILGINSDEVSRIEKDIAHPHTPWNTKPY